MSKKKQVEVILFNGPPGTGKDTAADYVVSLYKGCKEYNAIKLQFKDKLISLLCNIYEVHPKYVELLLRDPEKKEMPNENFDGLSIRQALIKVSEEVIKPNYGNYYFGLALARKLVKLCSIAHTDKVLVAVSDAGFKDEVEALKHYLENYGNGHDYNVTIVNLERSGHDYSNDSRGHLPGEYKVYNNRDEKFFEHLDIILTKIVR